jgi:hypothetical protein
VEFQLFVNSGSTLSGSTGGSPALFASSPLAAGSVMGITNEGNIYASNGAGGAGGSDAHPDGYPGSIGGTAISLPCDTTIDNGAGYIFGGGGGGGGMGRVILLAGDFRFGGGGGGGNPGGAFGVARDNNELQSQYRPQNGSTSVYGTADGGWTYEGFNSSEVQGGHGGDCLGTGTTADAALNCAGSFISSAAAGAPGSVGRAADLNGYTLIFTAGENPTQVKGDYT